MLVAPFSQPKGGFRKGDEMRFGVDLVASEEEIETAATPFVAAR